MNNRRLLFTLAAIVALAMPLQSKEYTILSPDKSLSVTLSDDSVLTYSVVLSGTTVLERSPLGIYRDDVAYPCAMTVSRALAQRTGNIDYDNPRGKCSHVAKSYTEQEFEVAQGKFAVVFRVLDDGVAFAYRLTGKGKGVKVYAEETGFRFPEGSRAFCSQLAKGKSGWCATNPSYEDHYHFDVPLGEESEHRQGWVFPLLVHNGDVWTLLSETGTDESYVACHLGEARDNCYQIKFPEDGHNMAYDPTWAAVDTPYLTPWRVMAVSRNIADIVATTLPDDLVEQKHVAQVEYKPGKAAWSWLFYADAWTTYDGSRKFIDMAAELGFGYCLIDAFWDQWIGRERIAELSAYAQQKGVRLLLWYNSNGNWNGASYLSPTNIMNNAEKRRAEMEWMRSIGVAGIKVDFFGGDKQNSIKLYTDILADCNRYGLICNFHGATLPRGWARMYPAFFNAEAVMGQEFCRGNHENEAMRARHITVLPFTRNAVAPMDFTPTVLNEVLGQDANLSLRSTTTAFELALPVIMFAPLSHYGLIPDDLKRMPRSLFDYFRKLPTVWDETRLLSGYPGRDVVMARRSGNVWYVAGINGEDTAKTIDVDLSQLAAKGSAQIFTTVAASRGEVACSEGNKADGTIKFALQPRDGFLIVIK